MTLRTRTLMIVCALMLAVTVGAQEGPITFHVSPQGNDAWSGRVADPADGDGPFATLQRARDAVTALKAEQDGVLDQPVRVLLREGTWRLEAPLELGPEISGSEDAPVTFAAYPGERPVLSGGVVIDGWSEQPDGSWQARVPGVAEGEWDFRQLFVREGDDAPWQRRYRPTMGAFVIAGLTDAPEFDSSMRHRQSQDEFRYHPDDIRQFENLSEVEVVALHSWSSSRLRIREIDEQEHVVRFTGRPVYRIGHWFRAGRNPYFLDNVKEAFGEPGRWYLDESTGTVSYMPLPGEDPAQMTFVAPRAQQLLRISGDAEAGEFVEHLRFRGIEFAHSAWELPEEGYSAGQGMTNLPAAVKVTRARDCAFEDCTVAHTGAYALSLGEGCHDNEVLGCRMYDLGGGGVKVGTGARNAEPPALATGNVVANCAIADGGLEHFSAHGIWVGITDGTRVEHNLVRDFLYSTVSVGWSWSDAPTSCKNNIVEANHLHDAMKLLSDGGGIYSLGFQPGTILRANHIHHVHESKFHGGAPNNGIFLDQGSSGFLIERNIFHHIAHSPIRHNQNSPDDHTFRGNFMDVPPESDEFPRALAEQAGLQPEYAHLADLPEVPTTPVLLMSPPPEPPLDEDFEGVPVGTMPMSGRRQGVEEPASIAVTDEYAMSGERSLKIQDAEGLSKPFYPYAIYYPEFEEGVVTIAFSLRCEAGAKVWVDARDYGQGFTSGPSVRWANGTMTVGEHEVALPADRWARVEMTVALGPDRTGTWSASVTPEGGETQQFADLPLSDDFAELEWVGFIAEAQADAAFYVDDVSVLAQ